MRAKLPSHLTIRIYVQLSRYRTSIINYNQDQHRFRAVKMQDRM
jgi:hypothetical protein